jgi:hypothetical protein
MVNTELNRLLVMHKLYFQWDEVSSSWRLSSHKEVSGNSDEHPNRSADNLEEAQAAAIRVLRTMSPRVYNPPRETTELEALLDKYRLTFNWGDPGLKWWLIGQKETSNKLYKTEPRPAKDIKTAKAEALEYIRANYQASSQEID